MAVAGRRLLVGSRVIKSKYNGNVALTLTSWDRDERKRTSEFVVLSILTDVSQPWERVEKGEGGTFVLSCSNVRHIYRSVDVGPMNKHTHDWFLVV